MTRLLDPSIAEETAQDIISNLEFDGGMSTEEMIPALIAAIVRLAFKSPHTDQLLDEASNMLADMGDGEYGT